MYKGMNEFYGTLGVERRYTLIKGWNIFMFSIKVKEKNIKGFHEYLIVGHARFLKTYQMINFFFFWELMKKDFQKIVSEW